MRKTFIVLLFSITISNLAAGNQARDSVASQGSVNGTNKPASVETGQSEFQRGYEAGLKQHAETLAEIQRELDVLKGQIEFAKVGNYIFVAVYSVLALIMAGSFFSTDSKMKVVRRAAEDATESAQDATRSAETAAGQARDSATQAELSGERAVTDANEVLAQARETLRESKSELSMINEARRGLSSYLRDYLESTLSQDRPLELQKPDASEDAAMRQLDHYTFLDIAFRYRKSYDDDELRYYCKSLIETARFHLKKQQPAESLLRIGMFFDIAKPEKVSRELYSRAHGYTAFANVQLLEQHGHRAALKQEEIIEKVYRWREQIQSGLRTAAELDQTWVLPNFLEAYFISNHPHPPRLSADTSETTPIFLAGQNRAIQLYRQLVAEFHRFTPIQVALCRQNLCCCLKRLGDKECGYDLLFEELRNLPTQRQIEDNSLRDRNSVDRDSGELWWKIAVDEVFLIETCIRASTLQSTNTGG